MSPNLPYFPSPILKKCCVFFQSDSVKAKKVKEEENLVEEEEFNPFADDFGEHDPWASKQQILEDDRFVHDVS